MDTIQVGKSNGNQEIIAMYSSSGKTRVRIFRPWECSKLIKSIPKKEYRIMFEGLLYSGLRYVEAQRLLDKPDMFTGDKIHLTPFAIRKHKIKIKERYVILSPIGKRVMESFIGLNKKLPDHNTWRDNLTRWCDLAGINTQFLSTKTTRKTYECWLFIYYPQYSNHIFLSQGHNDMVALKHYLGIAPGFTNQDKLDMKEFVYGWEP